MPWKWRGNLSEVDMLDVLSNNWSVRPESIIKWD